MPGHKDPNGHIEFIDGKAVLVIDEVKEVKKEVDEVKEVKKEVDEVKEVKKQSQFKTFKKNKKE